METADFQKGYAKALADLASILKEYSEGPVQTKISFHRKDWGVETVDLLALQKVIGLLKGTEIDSRLPEISICKDGHELYATIITNEMFPGFHVDCCMANQTHYHMGEFELPNSTIGAPSSVLYAGNPEPESPYPAVTMVYGDRKPDDKSKRIAYVDTDAICVIDENTCNYRDYVRTVAEKEQLKE